MTKPCELENHFYFLENILIYLHNKEEKYDYQWSNYKQWKKNKTNTENVTTYFHVTICHFFWHWHYLAKSCDTQMGTNKKRKKKHREQKWHGQENQVPLSCFAPPPYAYLVFPEKEKRLVSCLKSKSHCGETLSEVAFFFYAFCVFTGWTDHLWRPMLG